MNLGVLHRVGDCWRQFFIGQMQWNFFDIAMLNFGNFWSCDNV